MDLPGPNASLSRRFSVRGASGSGKSTFAVDLAGRLALPYIQLDALYWGPNWGEPTIEDFRARVTQAMAQAPDGWIIDGNYQSRLGDLVLDAADTVIWLDLPLHVTLRRLLTRTIGRLVRRTELWHGNRESWREHFASRQSLFLWSIRTHRRYRREWPSRLAGHPGFVRLRSENEVRRWLDAKSSDQGIASISPPPAAPAVEPRTE